MKGLGPFGALIALGVTFGAGESAPRQAAQEDDGATRTKEGEKSGSWQDNPIKVSLIHDTACI